jgi:hypothetical protein
MNTRERSINGKNPLSRIVVSYKKALFLPRKPIVTRTKRKSALLRDIA